MTTTDPSIAGDKTFTPCPNVSPTGRKCLLGIGHEGADRFMNRKPVGDAPKLPAGLILAATEVKPGEAFKKTIGTKELAPRDADQKRVDKDADKNYKANVGAGNHGGMPFESFKLSRYTVPPAAVDAVLAILRKCNAAGGPAKGGVFRYRKATVDGGNVAIQWAFVKPAPKGA